MDGRLYLRSDYEPPLRWVTALDSEIGRREQGFCHANLNETPRIGHRLGFPYNICHFGIFGASGLSVCSPFDFFFSSH